MNTDVLELGEQEIKHYELSYEHVDGEAIEVYVGYRNENYVEVLKHASSVCKTDDFICISEARTEL